MEIYWRDTGTCPTEAEYLEMIGNSESVLVVAGKLVTCVIDTALIETGGLLRLAVKLMQIACNSEKYAFVVLLDSSHRTSLAGC